MDAELQQLRAKVKRLQDHIRSESSRLAQIDASRNAAEEERDALRARCDDLKMSADSQARRAEKAEAALRIIQTKDTAAE